MTATISAAPTKLRRGSAAERTAGRDFYREALERGVELTPEEVGAQFDRTPAWGKNQIERVKQLLAMSGTGPTPPATEPDIADSTVAEPTETMQEAALPVQDRVQEFEPTQEPPPVPTTPPELPVTLLRPVEVMPSPPAVRPPRRWWQWWQTDAPRTNDGKFWSSLGLIVGILASIGANVMHAWTQGSASTWELIGAGLPPVALLITIEVLVRPPWGKGAWLIVIRILSVGSVAVAAASVSYRHMQSLLATWGEDSFNSHVSPIAVDGLMLICAAALMVISRNRSKTP